MRFETSQQMRLGQQMKLAPRMIQSMEILQMPMLALQERIEQELESNIALELAEPGGDEREDDAADQAASTVEERELVVGQDSNAPDDWERLSELESSYREAFDNEYSSSTYSPSRHAGERDRKMDALANVPARDESLTDQLLEQWRFAEVPRETALMGERLIGYIDDDGLLGASLDEVIAQHPMIDGVETNRERLESVLHEVQHWLEPAGIGAIDARESLLLQLDDHESRGVDGHWDDVRRIITDYFEDLLENRLPKIAHATGFSMERIAQAKTLMRDLDPTPGRALVHETAAPIIPDIIVEYDEEQDVYVAALGEGFLPVLRISGRYRTLAKDRTQDAPTREFAAENVRRATWLLEAINQRSSTLLRVVNVVLARQRDFFDHGPQHLKPMPMIEVADQLGIHVATVSRAVADKWMQTPRGLYPLRMFFSGGRETESGRDMSWEAVKATLREIVENEDKTKPLSDEALASALREKGIEIARRTVVKYRQQLGIPPARRRKEYGGGS